ncbi:hypothetical protein QAD02_017190 [Eretmocerus hayati]|uniref:Uncharacterized protein n=1 Tax=Eretmocerus hayati TaxID=131215 RepID=A0ACC2PE95_9HYME|nr:hypothetical protein QAD02_017190 [Eretmocerus hayati]
MEDKLSQNLSPTNDSSTMGPENDDQTMDESTNTQKSNRDTHQNSNNSNSGNVEKKSSMFIDCKMSNIAKLRQKFVEEIKDIELSLKESIKTLREKISEAAKKTDMMTENLKEANKLVCDQSELIYNKEQENKVLREKVEDLYAYQKLICENMEDVTCTIALQEKMSYQLMDEYNLIILMQQSDKKLLETNLKKIKPNEQLCAKLHEVNSKINNQDGLMNQYQFKINEMETKAQTIEAEKIQREQQLLHLEKKINELNQRNDDSKCKANLQKSQLIEDVEKFKKEFDLNRRENLQLDENINHLNVNLQTMRNGEQSLENEMKKFQEEIMSLCKELEDSRESQYKEDQENSITLDKLRDQLKTLQAELETAQKQENQATNVLQKKIIELQNKLKSYEGLEAKLKKYELEKEKEAESIDEINKSFEILEKENKEKLETINKVLLELKAKVDEKDRQILQSKNEIELLNKEVDELNSNTADNMRKPMSHTQTSSLLGKSISTKIPELFPSEELNDTEKQDIRKKLYTPTLADEDLDIDSLTIDEQVTHLTQSKSSQLDSPDKGKKFFRTSSLTQSKSKKEYTPRPRGRGKKY